MWPQVATQHKPSNAISTQVFHWVEFNFKLFMNLRNKHWHHFSTLVQPTRSWFRGGYTLLGSSIASLHFEKPTYHAHYYKTLMHIVKWIEDLCHLSFWSSNSFASLNNTRSLHSIYSNRSNTTINTPFQSKQNQAMQTIDKGWCTILKFLMILWWERYSINSRLDKHGIESLDGEVKRLTRNDSPRYNVMITILCLV
jgi:hypothetical protein